MKYNKQYKCLACGASFKTEFDARLCPQCGSSDVRLDLDHYQKARDTAVELIEKHNSLMKKALKKFDEYQELYAEVELVRSTLRTYKSRGIISDEEMPSIVRPKLSDRLIKKRNSKKGDKDESVL